MFFVLRVTSGPRVKLAGRKSTFNPPVVYSTDRFKAVVPVLVLLFVALWFILRVLRLALCYFVLVFFSLFSIAITSLWKERASLGAFRTFVRFALVWFCLFPLPLSVLEGLRFVIAVPDFSLTSFFTWLHSEIKSGVLKRWTCHSKTVRDVLTVAKKVWGDRGKFNI